MITESRKATLQVNELLETIKTLSNIVSGIVEDHNLHNLDFIADVNNGPYKNISWYSSSESC